MICFGPILVELCCLLDYSFRSAYFAHFFSAACKKEVLKTKFCLGLSTIFSLDYARLKVCSHNLLWKSVVTKIRSELHIILDDVHLRWTKE